MNRLIRRRLLEIKHYLVKTKPFHFVTESYSTIFSLIAIILVFKSRKKVLKVVMSRMFLSGVFIVSLALVRACA